MAALFNESNPYSAPQYGYSQNPDLQFYSGSSSAQVDDYSRPSLEGNVGSGGVANGTFVGGQIQGLLCPTPGEVMS